MTFSIYTPLETLKEYCEAAKRNAYPVTKILSSQIGCQKLSVLLQLIDEGFQKEWWSWDEFLAVLDEVPKSSSNQQILREVLLDLDRLDLDLATQQKVALAWSNYVEKYNDSKALFKRFQLLMESRPFSKGFKAVKEQFGMLEPIIQTLQVPFDGDLGKVMREATHRQKAKIDPDVFIRMELRWMVHQPSTLNRFNELILKIPSDDELAWLLAAIAFTKGAEAKNVDLLLFHLKKHQLIEETLSVLHYCLRNEYYFDCEYGYWCAEELLRTDASESYALITMMCKSELIDFTRHPEKQVRLFCYFSTKLVDEKNLISWISKALYFRDLNIWQGLEEDVLVCAEKCLKLDKVDYFYSFMSILLQTVEEDHPLYGRVCSLWKDLNLESDNHKNREILLKFSVYLQSRMTEPEFREKVIEMVKYKITEHPKSLESALDILVAYKITESEIWSTLFEKILQSNNIVFQRKACKAWLHLPSKEISDNWGIISKMVHRLDIDVLLLVLKKCQEEDLLLTIDNMEIIASSCLAICQNTKKGSKAKKEELLSVLSNIPIGTVETRDNARLFRRIYTPLIKCFLTYPTRENLDHCCDFFNSIINHHKEFDIDPMFLFNEIFLGVTRLNLKEDDELLLLLLLMAKELRTVHKTTATFTQTMSVLSLINTKESFLVTWLYFQNCLNDETFRQFTQSDLIIFESSFKKILSLCEEGNSIDNNIVSYLITHKNKFLLIFRNKKLPDYFVEYLDNKVRDFELEERDDITVWMRHYNCIYGYLIPLYTNPYRSAAFNFFLDFFINTVSRLNEKVEIEKMLTNLCQTFDRANYKDKSERNQCNQCLSAILSAFLYELSVIEQGTVYHTCLYTFVSDSLANVNQLCAIDLMTKFQLCWPRIDNDQFLIHTKIVLNFAEGLLKLNRNDMNGKLFVSSVLRNIIAKIEDHFEDLNDQQISSLTEYLVLALKCTKRYFKTDGYQKILIETLTQMLKAQKKSPINLQFLKVIGDLTCEINTHNPFLLEFLQYTLQMLKDEIQKEKINGDVFINLIGIGPQKLITHILKNDLMENDPKKYGLIFKEYMTILEEISSKFLNPSQRQIVRLLINLIALPQ